MEDVPDEVDEEEIRYDAALEPEKGDDHDGDGNDVDDIPETDGGEASDLAAPETEKGDDHDGDSEDPDDHDSETSSDSDSFSDAGLEGLEYLTGAMALRIFEYLDWRSLLIFCVYFDASLSLEAREAMAQGLTDIRQRLLSEVEEFEEEFTAHIEEREVVREVCKATAARLTRASLTELRSVRQAPLVCRDAMACVMILLDGETADLSWNNAVNMLSNPTTFLSRLSQLDSQALIMNPLLIMQLEDLLAYLPSTAADEHYAVQSPGESRKPSTPTQAAAAATPPRTPPGSSPQQRQWNASVRPDKNSTPISSPKKRFSNSPTSKRSSAIEATGHILARWVKETWLCVITESDIAEARTVLQDKLAHMHGIGVAACYVLNRLDEETSQVEAYFACLTPFESSVEKCHAKLQRFARKRKGGEVEAAAAGAGEIERREDGDQTPLPENSTAEDPNGDKETESSAESPSLSPSGRRIGSNTAESNTHSTIPTAGIWFWTHEFYATQCPEKLVSIHEVCDDWDGQEALLMASLRSKYMAQNMGAARSVRKITKFPSLVQNITYCFLHVLPKKHRY